MTTLELGAERASKSIFSCFIALCRTAIERRNAENELIRMTDHQLRDIGVNRWEIRKAVSQGIRSL
jgi:uncharacterized protein YjiS (DUF1127 family)